MDEDEEEICSNKKKKSLSNFGIKSFDSFSVTGNLKSRAAQSS